MSETVTAPDILNEIKAGRLVVVPREAEQRMLEAAGRYADGCAIHNYGAPPDADGTWDAMLAASPDHTTALLSLVEGMERERYEARGDARRASVIQTMRLQGLKPSDTVIELCAKYLEIAQAAEARALAAEAKVAEAATALTLAQARIRELETALAARSAEPVASESEPIVVKQAYPGGRFVIAYKGGALNGWSYPSAASAQADLDEIRAAFGLPPLANPTPRGPPMSDLTEKEIARAILLEEYGLSPEDAPNLYGKALSTGRLVMALLHPALERARREGLEAAAQYLEACDDYGDRYKAAEIRAIRKG